MKEKIYNPASTNETAPAKGMAAVNTYNSEEIDEQQEETGDKGIPKIFDRKEDERGQTDDTVPIVPGV
jgi:hypothetical protein